MRILLILAFAMKLTFPIVFAQGSGGEAVEEANTYWLQYSDTSGEQHIYCTGDKDYIRKTERNTESVLELDLELALVFGTGAFVVCYVELISGQTVLLPNVVEFVYDGFVVPVNLNNVRYINGTNLSTMRPGVVYIWAYPLPEISYGERFLMYVSGHNESATLVITESK